MTDEDRLFARYVVVFLEHSAALLRRAASLSASPQDLVQTVFLKGWAWFRDHRDVSDDDLKKVLFTIVRNTALDEKRHERCSPIVLSPGYGTDETTDPLEKVAADGPLPDELANRPDLVSVVRAAIQRIKSAKMRSLLELLYVDPSPTLQEVAETMGETYLNAKKLHERAKKKLKPLLLSLATE